MGDDGFQFNRVLIGLDDHEQARDALDLGAAVARSFDAEVLVAVAIEYDPGPLGRPYYDQARAEHFARLFAVADDHLGSLPYRRFELDQAPSSSLSELADREGVDLVVIGSTHRGLVERTTRGTVADALVEHVESAVLVAPHGYADRVHAGFGTLAVGCDGSASAARAIEVAEDVAVALDCELRLVCVVPSYGGATDPNRAAREGIYRERLAIGRRAVTRVPATPVIEVGNAPRELARQGLDADLIVVGSRGHGRLTRSIVGSVASELVRIAPCPVLVVPARHHPRRSEVGSEIAGATS